MNSRVRAVIFQRFAVPAEIVFDAWLEPEWKFGPGEGKKQTVRLESEPLIGGKFSLGIDRPEAEATYTGKFLELDRPGLLVFTWTGPDFPPGHGRVVVEILPCDDGCELTLTHVMDAGHAASVDRAANFWRALLGALAASFAETNPLTLNPT